MKPADPRILTINGGSSSIKFALFEAGDSLRRILDGKVDRIGLSGTNLTFRDATGLSRDSRTIDTDDHGAAIAFLLDWLERSRISFRSKPWGTGRAWDDT